MLDLLRSRYFAAWRKSIAEARTKLDKVVPEVMFDLPRSSEAELLFRLYRADIVGTSATGPRIIDVNVEPSGDDPERLEGLPIPATLYPASWNGLELRIDGSPPEERQLLAWIHKWLDPDDARFEENQEFQSTIHSCLRPRYDGATTVIAVDFGSAPVFALEELLLLVKNRARGVAIGSWSLMEAG